MSPFEYTLSMYSHCLLMQFSLQLRAEISFVHAKTLFSLKLISLLSNPIK